MGKSELPCLVLLGKMNESIEFRTHKTDSYWAYRFETVGKHMWSPKRKVVYLRYYFNDSLLWLGIRCSPKVN